jgi:hypothetical protein
MIEKVPASEKRESIQERKRKKRRKSQAYEVEEQKSVDVPTAVVSVPKVVRNRDEQE